MKYFFEKFIHDYKKQGFPIISVSLLTVGIPLYLKGYKIKNLLFSDNIPILPSSDSNKPTILIDYDILFKKKTWFTLPFTRKYTDVFLFHLCHLYELISITNHPKAKPDKIDPFGCISYHYFLPNRSDLKKKHLNRDNIICLTKDKKNLNNEFEQHILEIKSDFEDEKLMTILDFFNNLYFTNHKNWLKTLETYKEKDFLNSFSMIYKKLYFQKNFFKTESNYLNEKMGLNRQRISEFEKVKKIMEENIKKENYLRNRFEWKNIFTECIKFLI